MGDSSIEWTEVLVAVIGGFVVLAAPVIGYIFTRSKGHTSPDVQTEAIAQVEASSGIDKDSLSMAQDALRTAKRALEIQEADSRRLQATENRLCAVEQELSALQSSYRSLKTWADDLVARWNEYRHREQPPARPSDLH